MVRVSRVVEEQNSGVVEGMAVSFREPCPGEVRPEVAFQEVKHLEVEQKESQVVED